MKTLYLVETNKFSAYIIAEDPTEAYVKLRTKLEEWDYGFKKDRELKSVKVIAVETEWGLQDYGETHKLFL